MIVNKRKYPLAITVIFYPVTVQRINAPININVPEVKYFVNMDKMLLRVGLMD